MEVITEKLDTLAIKLHQARKMSMGRNESDVPKWTCYIMLVMVYSLINFYVIYSCQLLSKVFYNYMHFSADGLTKPAVISRSNFKVSDFSFVYLNF